MHIKVGWNLLSLKWMVQCHKDVYQNSILRLEYAYLLFNKFIMNRINSELIEIGRILTSFSVTESSCSDRIMLSLKFKLKKVSIDIFVYLELVFCLVLGTF